MPFGNGDRELLRQISSQLTQAVTDLAALKQQIADQQHAIDQIRQDATAAISTGLTEIRAVAREGLARTNDIVTGPVARIGNELMAVRGAIGQLDNQLRAAAAVTTPPVHEPSPEPPPVDDVQPAAKPEPEPKAQTETEPGQPQRPDEGDLKILRAAAGISAATLHAHRDTWEFLVKHAGRDQHFHLPGTATLDEGAIEVAVSGPTLVATLTSLAAVKDNPDIAPGTAAIAHHLHKRITDTVKAVIENPDRNSEGPGVKIVIDDRAPGDGGGTDTGDEIAEDAGHGSEGDGQPPQE
ncbi:hypothetical protein ACFYYD_22000 [Streptomyces bluensis]|uniref:hypothetical protein n=1 Tax=Streptomyces bluensis TaxID=33897 RepID=UPI003692C96F